MPIFEENGPDDFKGVDIMRAVRSFDPCLPCGVHMYLGERPDAAEGALADVRREPWLTRWPTSAPRLDDAAVRERLTGLDELLERVEQIPGPAGELALEAVSALAEVYGEALARALALAAEPARRSSRTSCSGTCWCCTASIPIRWSAASNGRWTRWRRRCASAAARSRWPAWTTGWRACG